MRILTLLGTRPEIIRLSRVIERLDQSCEHTVAFTGQNYDPGLSDLFFNELKLRMPDVSFGIRAVTFGDQVGQILARTEKLIDELRPDRLLILGDTNSGLGALVAKRRGVPVYHMEAGNRCHDDRVPEEINRRVIDHASDVLMPYTHGSRENLLAEGIPGNRVHVIGNPIGEVLTHFDDRIRASTILDRLQLRPREYFLVTMHRAENVDDHARLRNICEGLELVRARHGCPVICSLHPRTRNRMEQFGIRPEAQKIVFLDPLGLFDFVRLEREARCVLSDSGTVQEECCILKVPNVTLRDVTERPETLACGSNMLSGVAPDAILRTVSFVLGHEPAWNVPPEYLAPNVSLTVCRLVLGHHQPGRPA